MFTVECGAIVASGGSCVAQTTRPSPANPLQGVRAPLRDAQGVPDRLKYTATLKGVTMLAMSA